MNKVVTLHIFSWVNKTNGQVLGQRLFFQNKQFSQSWSWWWRFPLFVKLKQNLFSSSLVMFWYQEHTDSNTFSAFFEFFSCKCTTLFSKSLRPWIRAWAQQAELWGQSLERINKCLVTSVTGQIIASRPEDVIVSMKTSCLWTDHLNISAADQSADAGSCCTHV